MASLTDIAGDGDVRTFEVKSNGYWSVVALDADGMSAGWVTADPAAGIGNSSVTLTFFKNPSAGKTRKGQILVQLRDESKILSYDLLQGKASYTSGFKPIVSVLKGSSAKPEESVYGTLNTQNNEYTFSNGSSISLLGSTDLEYSYVSQWYRGVLKAKGWDAQDAAWLIKIPVSEELSGTLALSFGFLSDNATNCHVPQDWKIQWGTDGQNWSDIDELYYWAGSANRPTESCLSAEKTFALKPDISSENYYPKQAIFKVPDGSSIAKGSTLYIRIATAGVKPIKGTSLDPTHKLRFAYGFILSQYEKKSYNSRPLPQGDNVVLAEGFDDCLGGMDFLLNIGQLCNVSGTVFEKEGWEGENASSLVGYVRCGTSKAGSITTPALSALGSTPTDITIQFKATVYGAANNTWNKDLPVEVSIVEGPGEVEANISVDEFKNALAKFEDCFKFHDFTVKVKGATEATRIKFSRGERWYIDDIIITK